MLATVLGLVLGSCGESALFEPAPEAKLEASLAPSVGPELADKIAAAWKPALADMSRLEDAGTARDFSAYHQAVLSLRVTYAKGVDETIRLLDESPDQGWRRRMFSEAFAGDPSVAGGSGGDGAGEGLSDSFPTLGDESDETKAWFRGQLIANPRESGEIARALMEMQYDATRLSLYFVSAFGAEGAKSLGEAVDGFAHPREPSGHPR
jgi:hypothetical protein